MSTRTARAALPALATFAAACWPLDGLYDPDRCAPMCQAAQVCRAGVCVARDAGVDTPRDSLRPDGPALDRSLDRLRHEAAGDVPGHDGAAAASLAPDTQPLVVSSIGWKLIPKGTFAMGSPASEPCRGAWGSEETQHQVTLTRDFELMTTEASQELFERVMGYNNAHFGPYGAGATTCPSCPMESINWHEAAAFCNALSVAAALPQCYSCAGRGVAAICKTAAGYSAAKSIHACPGYRLPTEAEWERAYRAGTTSSLYNGTNATACKDTTVGDPNANQLAWYKPNSGNKPHPVGTLPANPWGLHNMAGNVIEWCHDAFVKDLGAATATDPVQEPVGATVEAVLRGGCFDNPADAVRAAARLGDRAIRRSRYRGVRCARTR
jgi:formylglycine-generating enzyme required for sulfatase activity